MILYMERLAQPTDAREARLERYVQGMIRIIICDALTNLHDYMDTLTMRVTTCDTRQGATSKVMTSIVEVPNLRKNVNYLKSIDISLLIGRVDDLGALQTLGISLATIGDVQRHSTTQENSCGDTEY